MAKATPKSHFDLSFARKLAPGEGCCWWSVKSTGSYQGDWEAGEALGAEYLTYIGEHPTYGSASLFGWIVGDMLAARRNGVLTGIELGFLSAVNKYAMSTAVLLECPIDLAIKAAREAAATIEAPHG